MALIARRYLGGKRHLYEYIIALVEIILNNGNCKMDKKSNQILKKMNEFRASRDGNDFCKYKCILKSSIIIFNFSPRSNWPHTFQIHTSILNTVFNVIFSHWSSWFWFYIVQIWKEKRKYSIDWWNRSKTNSFERIQTHDIQCQVQFSFESSQKYSMYDGQLHLWTKKNIIWIVYFRRVSTSNCLTLLSFSLYGYRKFGRVILLIDRTAMICVLDRKKEVRVKIKYVCCVEIAHTHSEANEWSL